MSVVCNNHLVAMSIGKKTDGKHMALAGSRWGCASVWSQLLPEQVSAGVLRLRGRESGLHGERSE